MDIRRWFIVVCSLVVLLVATSGFGVASATESPLEKAMSDTLDTWRDGRYEQLFEQLAHRGKTSREAFVKKMQESTIRPACCWQKIENFRVLSEKRTEATVYAKIGLEGAANSGSSTTREFRMTHEGGGWKMQLADVTSIAGTTGKKKGGAKRNSKDSSPYLTVPN
ncbi:MAG: hypothetical protein PHY09_14930 [Desulfuromonadaceae bacterium]|nr:hypothetical protein [Desulfuromonadaceae bacterium]MDD5106556.1 hypothetical protein [Desulfuromonadaceae bacterium]